MMKRILSFALLIALAITMFPTSAFAFVEQSGSTIGLDYSGGAPASVFGNTKGYAYTVNIKAGDAGSLQNSTTGEIDATKAQNALKTAVTDKYHDQVGTGRTSNGFVWIANTLYGCGASRCTVAGDVIDKWCGHPDTVAANIKVAIGNNPSKADGQSISTPTVPNRLAKLLYIDSSNTAQSRKSVVFDSEYLTPAGNCSACTTVEDKNKCRRARAVKELVSDFATYFGGDWVGYNSTFYISGKMGCYKYVNSAGSLVTNLKAGVLPTVIIVPCVQINDKNNRIAISWAYWSRNNLASMVPSDYVTKIENIFKRNDNGLGATGANIGYWAYSPFLDDFLPRLPITPKLALTATDEKISKTESAWKADPTVLTTLEYKFNCDVDAWSNIDKTMMDGTYTANVKVTTWLQGDYATGNVGGTTSFNTNAPSWGNGPSTPSIKYLGTNTKALDGTASTRLTKDQLKRFLGVGATDTVKMENISKMTILKPDLIAKAPDIIWSAYYELVIYKNGVPLPDSPSKTNTATDNQVLQTTESPKGKWSLWVSPNTKDNVVINPGATGYPWTTACFSGAGSEAVYAYWAQLKKTNPNAKWRIYINDNTYKWTASSAAAPSGLTKINPTAYTTTKIGTHPNTWPRNLADGDSVDSLKAWITGEGTTGAKLSLPNSPSSPSPGWFNSLTAPGTATANNVMMADVSAQASLQFYEGTTVYDTIDLGVSTGTAYYYFNDRIEGSWNIVDNPKGKVTTPYASDTLKSDADFRQDAATLAKIQTRYNALGTSTSWVLRMTTRSVTAVNGGSVSYVAPTHQFASGNSWATLSQYITTGSTMRIPLPNVTVTMPSAVLDEIRFNDVAQAELVLNGSVIIPLGRASDYGSWITRDPVLDPIYWASDIRGQAYAELKQGSYSDTRSAETWEAMAGVPHNQTMYVDAGGKAFAVAANRTRAETLSKEWAESNTRNEGLKSVLSNSGTYTVSSQASSCYVNGAGSHGCSTRHGEQGGWCHGCSAGGCHNGCGTTSKAHPISCTHCNGHNCGGGSPSKPSSGTPGQPGYTPGTPASYCSHGNISSHTYRCSGCTHPNDGYYDYGTHHNCSGSSCHRTQSWSYSMPSLSVFAYQVDAYRILDPASFTFNHQAVSSENFTRGRGFSVSETTGSLSGWSETGFSLPAYPNCREMDQKYYEDSRNKLQERAPSISATYTGPSFTITAPGGSMTLLRSATGTFRLSSWNKNGGGEWSGYTGYWVNGGQTLSHKYDQDTERRYLMWDVVSDATIRNKRTNFEPQLVASNRDAPHLSQNLASSIPYVGYNGTYNGGSSRRGGSTAAFYKSGLSIISTANGIKSGLTSPMTYDNTLLRNGPKVSADNLPRFTAPSTWMASGGGNGQFVMNASYSPGYKTTPNDIVVHSPIALRFAYTSLTSALTNVDDVIQSSELLSGSQYIRPGAEFQLTVDHSWLSARRDNSDGGIGNVTTSTGKSYQMGLSTVPWIAQREIRFSFDVELNGTRYPANTWFNLPGPIQLVQTFTFFLPVSELETKTGTYDIRVTATNSSPASASAAQENIDRRSSDYAAANQIYQTYGVRIVGLIGSFVIENTTDPTTWKDWFTTKYVGAARTLYNQASSALPFHDYFNTIPNLRKAPTFTAPVPGTSNLTTIKMGYPVTYSIQTVGNYENVNMVNNVTYQLIDVRNPANPQWVDADLYYFDGTAYKPLSAYTTSHNLADPLVKITGTERSASNSTKLTTGNKTKIGSNIYQYTLTPQLNTRIGSSLSRPLGTKTEALHQQQAQRWHGVHMLPNTTIAVPRGQTPNPNKSNFLGKGYILTVGFTFTTNGPVWGLTKTSPLCLSNQHVTIKTRDRQTISVVVPDETVLVYDMTLNTTDDNESGGTH